MKNYKTLIYIILAIIAVGLLVYFVYIPQIKADVNLWAKNTIKQMEISNLESKKADINKLKNEEKEASDLSTALASMLPDKKEAGTFIIEVEALAKNTNVDFIDIKFSEEKKTAATTSSSSSSTTDDTTKAKTSVKGTTTSKFKELTFEMNIKGSYTDLINFLKGLEKIKRALLIEKYDMSSVKDIVQASVKGKAYYKND